MNVFLLSTAVFVLYIAADILTAKLLKIKRTLPRNVSLALLCVLAVSSGTFGVITLVKNADTTTKTLYNAYSYLLEGNATKATENATRVQSPHSDVILLLADCVAGDYASAFISSDDLKNSGKLNDDLLEQTDKVYRLSRQMTGLEGAAPTTQEVDEEVTEITNDCFSLLKVSEKSEVEFLSGFKRDRMLASDDFHDVDSQTLSEMLLETPDDTELLRYSVKYYNAAGGLDTAEENARKLLDEKKSVDNIVLYTDVLAQKLINDVSITSYDENDKEVAALVKKAEDAQKTAESYEQDNPRRDESIAKAEEYRKQENGVKAKRIINWLTAQSPLFGDNSGVIDLQLSKLYTASGDEAKAREILLGLLKREKNISDSSSVKSALAELGSVYNDASASDDDILQAINTVLHSDAFLPDSVLNRGYSQFLNNLLKYERVSVFISRVNTDNYPTVRAYLNVYGKKDGAEELANDFEIGDFTFADNGFKIENKNVRRIEDDSSNSISIALVIDGSGSMQGDRIENARKAVESCIRNLSAESQELSIVLYADTGEVLTPLTNDTAKLQQGAAQINADGGTVISSGLLSGLESLENAVGTKAIILMTDGEDGSPETMDDAITAAKEANAAVFTVSTGGGNREYMENIAQQTGGSYMEAVTDSELVNVYTALQNYIVNNYCFEYTVTDAPESNPRNLTIGLKDYEVSSSRTYGYGGLMIAKDGSYITRGDSGSLRLLYAEPAVVSVEDAELGVPIFINAVGAVSGTKVFINGDEVSNVKTIHDSVIAFTLKGKYKPGALNVTVKLPDGTSRNTDKLLAISGSTIKKAAGQTILLGRAGNTLYADHVEQKDEYTLKLSGNVILNGFLRTASAVTVQANTPITAGGNRLTISDGSITGNGEAFVDFASSNSGTANYGQMAFSGKSVKVLDSFSFRFDDTSIHMNDSGATLTLPGFGTVDGNAQFDGSELMITANGGQLFELLNNLNYVLNSVPLTQNRTSAAIRAITGHSQPNQSVSDNSYGIQAHVETITITIKKDFASVVGSGTVNGYLGLVEISDGKLTIDTSNTASMFDISGIAKFDSLPDAMGVDGQTPLTIRSKGWYPDGITVKATGFYVDATGLSACFSQGTRPRSLDGAIRVNYPLTIEKEPYRQQISPLLNDVSLTCDKVEFVCTSDRNENGIKAYNASNPNQYVVFRNNGVVIPISEVGEFSLFGSDLGGEISGEATVNDRQIDLSLDVDGHLDNSYFGIKHDGKANLTVSLPRNANPGSSVPVTLTYGGKILPYNAAVIGNISPQDGFYGYAEDNE